MELLQSLKDQLRNEQHTKDTETQSGLDTTETDRRIAALNQQIAEAESRQEHENRIQEATAESDNFLDDIEIAGVPIAESGLSELAFGILKAKAQAKYIAKVEALSLAFNEQKAQYQADIKQVFERATEAEGKVEHLQSENNRLETANYQITLDNESLSEKVTKSADLLHEANQAIEQQKEEIEKWRNEALLKTNNAPKPYQSTSEQIRLQEEAIKASRIRVTSMVADPDDFSKRKWTVTLALTGETKEINYLEKGNYTVISEEEAEQLRADEANRLQELEAQNEAIPTQEAELEPVHSVLEEEAPIQENTFPEGNQVDADTNGEDQAAEGNGTLDEVVDEESEVVTRAEFAELKKRVWDLENGFTQAVA